MATVDVVTVNGEQDLFDLRYQILKDYVDEFIVIEFDRTFSGKPKQSTFTQNYPKVTYHFVTEDVYSKYQELAQGSPNTKGADHWKREFCQKESIKDYLTHLQDSDWVYIGDVDEIWNPDFKIPFYPIKLKLRVYTYYLNNRSTESFCGTLVSTYGLIKDDSLNRMRSDTRYYAQPYAGWHFTSMGGPEALKKKLTDSYTSESYATLDVLNRVDTGYGRQDFLGRSFTYVTDESEWPQYLKDHKDQWNHLLV